MSYKTIVVLLDRAWRAEQLEVAFALAHGMDAHVVGLYAVRPMMVPAYALVEAGPIADELHKIRRADIVRREEEARTAFKAAAARGGLAKTEWRIAKEEALAAACLSARYADLVIAGQPMPGLDETGTAPDVHRSLALATGRPVLLVPYAGRFAEVGRNILIAWNASRESARAVADGLPLLRKAESVRVVVFNPGPEHGEEPGADIALHLARHGVKVSVDTRINKDVGIGELILSYAADTGADLIVMGAYGHSRIRELVFGGATRTLLESMTVPVLMSH